MLPQKKSLLRRNAWFRQQLLQHSGPASATDLIAANDDSSCSQSQQAAMVKAHSGNTATNNQSEHPF
jgi:hypothetical protein